ncbi:PilZ domain-containing protein [uncultured Massilia sp.]|uniref:PilZ domain-containing protein n=1 Tax=uncultured Massilia sp. TaxID=169973 RepID=UPI0025D0BE54|nr:PilZ domain-containing protein [uncultured Massilia sp.]
MTDLAFAPMRKGPPSLADAVERITLNSIAHEMRDPFDIGDALATLSATGEAVTVYPPGRDFTMARIDAIDTDASTFLLDLAEDVTLPEGRIAFVAALGSNAKMQFELDADWAMVRGAGRRVQMPFPEVCLVLNRRAEQRLDTPVGGNYGARFTLLGKVFDMPLYDFSRNGVGLRATPEQALELYVGKKIENVELEMGPSLVVQADLEVRLLRPFRTFLLGAQVQVGCRISNMSMQMRQSLDRAVTKVEQRR